MKLCHSLWTNPCPKTGLLYQCGYTVGNLVLRQRASGAVNFISDHIYIYIYDRNTSRNKNFEYSYPLSVLRPRLFWKITTKLHKGVIVSVMSIKHANTYKVCLADKAFTINDGISVIVVVRQLFFRTQFTINANASFRKK